MTTRQERPMQDRILRALRGQGWMRTADIARRLDVATRTVSTTIARMAYAGLVDRSVDPDHRGRHRYRVPAIPTTSGRPLAGRDRMEPEAVILGRRKGNSPAPVAYEGYHEAVSLLSAAFHTPSIPQGRILWRFRGGPLDGGRRDDHGRLSNRATEAAIWIRREVEAPICCDVPLLSLIRRLLGEAMEDRNAGAVIPSIYVSRPIHEPFYYVDAAAVPRVPYLEAPDGGPWPRGVALHARLGHRGGVATLRPSAWLRPPERREYIYSAAHAIVNAFDLEEVRRVHSTA